MALNFQGGRIVLGTEFSGWKIYIYEPNSSTDKTNYKEQTLTNANTQPVVLDQYGGAQIWFNGNAKWVIHDADDNEIYSDDNVNVGASGVASGAYNLVLNPSFEDDDDGDGIPDNWDQTLYTGGAAALDSTDQVNGSQSIKFTSTGTGGGYLQSTSFIPVTAGIDYACSFWIKSSAVDVRNIVTVYWYQSDQTASATPSTSIYDEAAANPVSWTEKFATGLTAPADATYAKIRLDGCNSADATAGNTKFDSVYFGQPRLRDILTTAGDILYASAADTPARLAIPAEGGMYKSVGGVPKAGLPNNYITGLILSNDTDTDHDINVTAGMADSADNDTALILTSEITKQIDATWASGDDAGGLSSSLTAPANDTWYHVFLVEIGGAVDVLFDTSITCANGVTDHSVTNYRRIGSVLTDGSANIIQFKQIGDNFIWDAYQQDLAAASIAASKTARVISTPLGVSCIANISLFANNTGGTPVYYAVIDGLSSETGADNTTYTMSGVAAGTGYNRAPTNNLLIQTDTSSQIYTEASAVNSATTLYINTRSYRDFRGQYG